MLLCGGVCYMLHVCRCGELNAMHSRKKFGDIRPDERVNTNCQLIYWYICLIEQFNLGIARVCGNILSTYQGNLKLSKSPFTKAPLCKLVYTKYIRNKICLHFDLKDVIVCFHLYDP